MNIEKGQLKIAFLTAMDAHDRRSWSGTFFYSAQALQKHCGDVSFIGPIHCKEKRIANGINKISRTLLKKNFMGYHCFLVARKHAKIAAQRLTKHSYDLIVAFAGETEIAFLETDIPIILVEDATYGQLHNYHPNYYNLLNRSIYEINTVEAKALHRASKVISSSRWAALSAIEDYGIDERKVHVVPFGANFEEPPSQRMTLSRKKSTQCKLLFVGVNWEAKGGDIVFETLLKLEEMGILAEVVVCGCTPPQSFSHERLQVIPFLNKNDENQRRQLEQLFLTSDFFILPTRADCTPIVFCEAGAFGLPVIATDIGGISEIIKEGVNGFLLPYSARGDAYAKVIAQIYQDDDRYAELVKSSRAQFEERLNWDAWGIAVKEIIDELVDRNKETV